MSVSATRVEIYDATCPGGVSSVAPTELTLFAPGDYDLVAVQVVIPDGHAGMTGIAFAIGHQIILPRNPGAWISGNDEEPRFTLKGYTRGAPWTVFVCNDDIIAHTWELRFEFDDSAPMVLPTLTAQPLSAISIEAASSPSGP